MRDVGREEKEKWRISMEEWREKEKQGCGRV